MAERSRKDIAAILADDKLIDAALKRGVRDALLEHYQTGHAVVEWRDGKTVWLYGEEINQRVQEIDELGLW